MITEKQQSICRGTRTGRAVGRRVAQALLGIMRETTRRQEEMRGNEKEESLESGNKQGPDVTGAEGT
jgi:hypothetical protein